MSSNDQKLSAKQLVDALRQFESSIPDYAHLTNDERLALRRVATLDPEWVIHAVNAIGASRVISNVVASTDAELREEMADMGRWTEVEQQLRATLQGVEGANLIRRHRLNLKALQAYGVLRQLVRQPEHQDLLSYYETL